MYGHNGYGCGEGTNCKVYTTGILEYIYCSYSLAICIPTYPLFKACEYDPDEVKKLLTQHPIAVVTLLKTCI